MSDIVEADTNKDFTQEINTEAKSAVETPAGKNRAMYRGGENQNVFPIPFAFSASSHIRASVVDVSGHSRALSAGHDFTVNMISDGNGELILLGDALPSGWTLVIKRLVPIARRLPFPRGKLDMSQVTGAIPLSSSGIRSGTTAEEMRRHEYEVRTDPIRDIALSYLLEAEACRREGDASGERHATIRYDRSLAAYLTEKRHIRSAFVSGGTCAKAEIRSDYAESGDAVHGRVFLGSSGVCHAAGCGFAKGDGEWLEPEEARLKGEGVRPCLRCRPDIGSNN